MSNQTLAVIVELVGGYFGLLGVGWMIAGDVLRGLLILIGYGILLAIFAFLISISFGFLGFIIVPFYIIIPIISAFKVYQFADDKW